MHIDGKGNVDQLATGVKAILGKVAEVRGKDPRAGKADSVINTISIPMLDSIIGNKGELNKGVYKYTIGRPDVMLQEHGMGSGASGEAGEGAQSCARSNR